MSVKTKIHEMFEAGEITEAQAFKAAVFIEDLEKNASAFGAFGAAAKGLGKVIGYGLGFAATGYAADKGISYIESRGDSARSESMFNDVIRYNPELMRKDPDKVKDIFRTLARFAPSLAADPHAASSYIKRIMDFDPEQGADYGVIRTLVQLEKDYQDTRATRLKPASGAISSGMEIAGKGLLSDTVYPRAIGDAPKLPYDSLTNTRL